MIDADYQQEKSTLYWGDSSETRETYYFYKFNHNIFSITNYYIWRTRKGRKD